jgi:hypothetical protein
MIFPMNYSDYATDSDDIKDNNEIETDLDTIETIEKPKSSIVGNDTWWNIDWFYRQLITIENDNDVGFENYPVKIVLNYTELVNLEHGMNASCKDIRIVENGVLRKYYFIQDYPIAQNVTIWFETDIAKGPGIVEYDTYLYYGNRDAEIDTTYFMNESSADPAEAYGWIRNGGFEWDHPVGDKIFSCFGWNYSNNPPSDIDAGDGEQNPASYEHGILQTGQALNQERILEGSYTFKWGDNDPYVDDTPIINALGQDYEGRLFSYPFIIPTLTGNPSAELYLTGYINIRSYTKQPQNPNGYLLRISNYTNYGQPGSDLGTYKIYQNYESSHKQTTAITLDRLTGPLSFPSRADTRNDTVGPPYNNAGELTGYFNDFDITNWQGQCVFLEASTYGPETGKKRSVFTQVDGFSFNYELDVKLEVDVQRVQGEITVITKDVDGRIVPNAEVSLTTTPTRKQFTDDTGETLFSNIAYGTYNFTVNYTLSTGRETLVFDSTKPGEDNYTFDESQAAYEIILILNMSTIDFEIVDRVGRPLDYGFVNVKESKNGVALENLTLDSSGTATFRWLNVSSYYYEVYYNNSDYANIPMKLNESIILRSDYVQANEKFQTQTFWVNKTNILGAGTNYEVNQYLYTNGSTTEIGNKKIINFTVTLEDMDNFLTNVSIYYVDESNSTAGNLIFTNTSYTPSDNSDTIEITIRDPPVECANLEADNYEVYGILLIVKGVNNTLVCNGRITVDLVETRNVYNRTALARMNIRVVDQGNPVDVARVLVSQGSNSIINLSSYVDKGPELLSSDGWAYGRINYLVPFWYFIGQSYNFSIKMSGQLVDFEVNITLNTTLTSDIEQWKPAGTVLAGNEYNVTMTYDDGILIFDVGVAGITQQTRFNDTSYRITEQVTWGEIIDVSIYYEYTIGAGWLPMPNTGNVMISFKTVGIGGQVYLSDSMAYAGGGTLTYTINSSLLTAGTDAQAYVVTISADEEDYVNPSDIINYTVVIALETGLSIHNYSINYELQLDYSQYFGELINISIKYYDNNTKLAIAGASLFYDWLNLGDIQFYKDPLNNSFYTATLNTSLAGSVGLESIIITAYKENYTIQENILISLRILERPTYINNNTGFYYFTQGIWIKDVYNFTFEYRDIFKDERISDLDIYEYTWQKTDAVGNPIIGQSGDGGLVENGDNMYILDFDTEKKTVGNYLLYVSLHKDNYELRTAIINFIVNIRLFDAELEADPDEDDDQITVVHGNDVDIEITLWDETRNVPLTGASVVLDIGGKEYDFDEESAGVYTLTFETDDLEAFFTSKTLTGEITIEKVDFADDEIEITIVVTMEEIFEGMPTFYFIMIVSSISAVVGALVGYRVIQQARIPKFVKKVRSVKKAIKSKSSVPSISIPTKNKMFMKELGKEWGDLGISLRSILGIEEKKSQILSKAKELIKQKGGDK